VEEALNWATDGILDEEVSIEEGDTVVLPRVFQWYPKDFGIGKKETVRHHHFSFLQQNTQQQIPSLFCRSYG